MASRFVHNEIDKDRGEGTGWRIRNLRFSESGLLHQGVREFTGTVQVATPKSVLQAGSVNPLAILYRTPDTNVRREATFLKLMSIFEDDVGLSLKVRNIMM